MRAFITLALTAAVASTTAMASAPGNQSSDQNRIAQAKPTATAEAAKPAEPKICRRLAQGKVCMTAKKWKEYDEML